MLLNGTSNAMVIKDPTWISIRMERKEKDDSFTARSVRFPSSFLYLYAGVGEVIRGRFIHANRRRYGMSGRGGDYILSNGDPSSEPMLMEWNGSNVFEWYQVVTPSIARHDEASTTMIESGSNPKSSRNSREILPGAGQEDQTERPRLPPPGLPTGD
ncbi:hypothetical protein B0H34DRAFT_807190 [Crassisporium funariophilum]|nr:hypothetical protein B0H34DRAFT_807190 [Crassisporium funariophilum]